MRLVVKQIIPICNARSLVALAYTSLLFMLIRLGFFYALESRFAQALSVCSSLLWRVESGRGRAHADLRPCAGLPLLAVLHRRRLLRQHGAAKGGDTETPGALRDRQLPGHRARMRLRPLRHAARLAPESADRARADL